MRKLITALLALTAINVYALDSNSIVSKNNIFLSPHYDDILLTFGGTIHTNSQSFNNSKVTIYDFFSVSNWTGNDENIQSNQRISKVTAQRNSEDVQVFNQLFNGQLKYRMITMGYLEAPLRNYSGPKTAGGGPGGNFSTFRSDEINLYNNIYQDVKPILKQDNCSVFLLSAIGYHIDHFILREAVIRAAHDLGSEAKCKIYFGEDEPYTGANMDKSNVQINAFKQRLNLTPIDIKADAKWKVDMFNNNYYSQYESGYDEGVSNRIKVLNGHERLYLWQDYARAHTDPSCNQNFCKY